MKLGAKIGIGSGIAFIVITILGFIVLPYVLKSQIKSNLTLKPEGEVRAFYTKLPFALNFKIYVFNVTNPQDVIKGDSPVLDEIGPYFFEEWKEKVDVVDNETEDELTYRQKITWKFRKDLSAPGLTGEEIVNMAHPIMVGMSVVVLREKPAFLSLANKAINEIFGNPKTPFLTAPVMDILFRGVVINCSVTEFSAKAVCNQLRTEAKDLEHVSDTIFKFSILGMKNGTIDDHTMTVKRGIQNSHDVGRVVAYDGAKEMKVWPTKECNQFVGTDQTIFPPFLTKEEGIAAFGPEFCRSLVATFDKESDFMGVPVNHYSATLGDMSTDESLKCYCPTNETCWKQGLHDLSKCIGAPLIISLPHFYDCDPSYLHGVRGLHPNQQEHAMMLTFETMTGTPIKGRKRAQFNLPLMPIPKITVMQGVPDIVIPLLWVEEGADLPDAFLEKLVGFFNVLKIIKIANFVVIFLSLVGMGIGAYLHYRNKDQFAVTKAVKPVKKEPDSEKKGISMIG